MACPWIKLKNNAVVLNNSKPVNRVIPQVGLRDTSCPTLPALKSGITKRLIRRRYESVRQRYRLPTKARNIGFQAQLRKAL